MARFGRLLTEAQWEKIQPLLPRHRPRPRGGRPVSRQNLIRAGNGASRFVPRIENRTWIGLRVALRSAEVLFRRGPGHMRRSYEWRVGWIGLGRRNSASLASGQGWRPSRYCAKTVPKVYGIEGKGVRQLSESRAPN
jgi:hypothetical protein